jgi:hypothetical protein
LDGYVREARIRWGALAWALAGRLLQTVQYGVLLAAVGGSASVSAAFIAEAIHLVGAGLGDLVPNAVGITEGAYRLFADVLGLAETPARAIGIALLARLVQLVLATLGLLLGGSVKPRAGSVADSEAGETRSQP